MLNTRYVVDSKRGYSCLLIKKTYHLDPRLLLPLILGILLWLSVVYAWNKKLTKGLPKGTFFSSNTVSVFSDLLDFLDYFGIEDFSISSKNNKLDDSFMKISFKHILGVLLCLISFSEIFAVIRKTLFRFWYRFKYSLINKLDYYLVEYKHIFQRWQI